MLIILSLALLTAFVFGWNNSSLCTGGLTSSGLLSYKKSVALASLGLALGALIEGGKMKMSLIGFVTESTSTPALLSIFITTLSLMLILTLLPIPASLSHLSVGAYVGANFAIGSLIDTNALGLIILSWLLVPVFSAIITMLLYLLTTRIAQRFSLLTLDAFNRVAVMTVVFYIAYALGANNIGMMNGLYMPFIYDDLVLSELMITIMAISAVMGIVIFGKRITKTVGEDLIVLSPKGVITGMFSSALLMWLFTQFSIPISMTQAIVGGIIGAGLVKRHVIFNRIILYEIIGSWIVVITIGFIMSVLIMRFFG
ncbi:MAG: inorganic phosphate transporter [Nitrososphaerales archaeon]|nr:inorganic phosphate transporter [Nitrososphaerales archaeon]